MKIESSWGFCLGKVSQEMDKRFAKKLKQIGLDYRDSRYYGALLAIHTYPNLTQLKIGEKLGLDRTTIGQLVEDLENKDFIARKRNPKDRRQNILVLTDKGFQTVEMMWEEMKAIEKDVIHHLSNSQKEAFIAIAREIGDK